ncbi:MAG: hypothetical protein OXU53_02695 [Deltaproteobacteria bacterium]|nr:hypothetical protein [Deltaproteobacteria bacterium]
MPCARRCAARRCAVGVRPLRWLMLALLAAPLPCGGAGAGAAPPPAENWRFELARGFERAEGALAVAVDARGEQLAVGDARGAWLGRPAGGRAAQRVYRGAPVHDLAFDGNGALWLATEEGLFELAGGAALDRGPAPGAARRVLRVLPTGQGVFAATAQGIFWLRNGARRPLGGGAPRGEATALAWQPGAAVLLAVVEGALYEIAFAADAREGRGRQVQLGARVLDVFANGGAALALGERALWRREQGGRWRAHRPALPPGAAASRIALAGGQVWLASQTGLLAAPALAGPWRRVPGPRSIGALAVAGPGWALAAAGARGPWWGMPGAGRADAAPRHPGDPPIQQVQRAALRYAGLESKRLRSLRRRVRGRGWLPTLEISGNYGGGRDWDFAASEVATNRVYMDRPLNSTSWDRDRDFGAGARLTWDFGDTAYHPEEIDVSRELREIIELRDEVLDEVNHLYFERQRVLLERAALEDLRSPKAVRLALRAAELAAGLDSWTGGWWSATTHPAR